MAQYSGTWDTAASVGNREDLADIIYLLKPIETPLMSGIGRSEATGIKHEWQQDSPEAAVANNAVVEGDDSPAGSTAATNWLRLGNACQISRKVAVVSGTQEAVMKAGRKSDIALLIAKRGMELKRDMECTLSQNSVALGSGTRTSAGFETWCRTNDVGTAGASPANRGTSGAAGSAYSGNMPTGAPTDGTLRNFDEDILKNVLQKVFTSGGHPGLVIAPPKMKQRISGFTGKDSTLTTTVTKFNEVSEKTLTAAIDIYVSDFGTLNVQPSRFTRTRSVLVVDTEYAAVAYLRPFQSFPLAKTGDAEKRELLAEYCLEMRNEMAQGICADLQ